jgi:hypothetical protein
LSLLCHCFMALAPLPPIPRHMTLPQVVPRHRHAFSIAPFTWPTASHQASRDRDMAVTLPHCAKYSQRSLDHSATVPPPMAWPVPPPIHGVIEEKHHFSRKALDFGAHGEAPLPLLEAPMPSVMASDRGAGVEKRGERGAIGERSAAFVDSPAVAPLPSSARGSPFPMREAPTPDAPLRGSALLGGRARGRRLSPRAAPVSRRLSRKRQYPLGRGAERRGALRKEER